MIKINNLVRVFFIIYAFLIVYPILPKKVRFDTVDDIVLKLSKKIYIGESNLFTSFHNNKYIINNIDFFIIKNNKKINIDITKNTNSFARIAKLSQVTNLFQLYLKSNFSKDSSLNVFEVVAKTNFKFKHFSRFRDHIFEGKVKINSYKEIYSKTFCHHLQNQNQILYSDIIITNIDSRKKKFMHLSVGEIYCDI